MPIQIQTIHIHREAPPKPLLGAPCNGCGVCCAAEPCSVSRIFLQRRQGACPALEWGDGARRYYCGMVQWPSRYIRWLPGQFNKIAGRFFAGWLAAGEGCDSDSETIG